MNYWRFYIRSEDKLVPLSTAGERALPIFSRICGRQKKNIIKKTGNLISRSKRQNAAVLREYLQLHQSSELELKSLRVVLSHREHLPGIFSKIRAQTKKSSQARRRARARRAKVLDGDIQLELNDQ